LDCQRSLFLYIKALFEALEAVAGVAGQESGCDLLSDFLAHFVTALHVTDAIAEKVDRKTLYLYIDDRYSTTNRLKREGTTTHPQHITVVDYGSQIIRLIVTICQHDTSAMERISDNCRAVLINRWICLPSKMARCNVGKALVALSTSVVHRDNLIAVGTSVVREGLSAKDTSLTRHGYFVQCAAWISTMTRLLLNSDNSSRSEVESLMQKCRDVLARFMVDASPMAVAHVILVAEAIDSFGRLWAFCSYNSFAVLDQEFLSLLERCLRSPEHVLVQEACQVACRVVAAAPTLG